MSETLQQRLDRLRSKSEIFTSRYQLLLEEKRAADALIKELERELEARNREISRLRQQVEYLTVVTTIAPSREAIEQSRTILSGLVRDIDKCISELTE